MTVVKTSTKLHIPHTLGNFILVGVLEQLEPHRPTNGRKIALVGLPIPALHSHVTEDPTQILHGTMG